MLNQGRQSGSVNITFSLTFIQKACLLVAAGRSPRKKAPMPEKRATPLQLLSIIMLCAFAIGGIAIQEPKSWLFWILGVIVVMFCERDFRNHLMLLFGSLALLGFTPIDTDISWGAIGHFTIMLSIVLLAPWAVAKFVLKTNAIEFQFGWRQRWTKTRIIYVPVAFFLSYLIFPWYLKDTSAPAFLNVPAFENWMVGIEWSPLFRLFLGTNGLGIWDELFFINVVYAVLRRYVPIWQANAFQAVLFTSFLFELGFTGWGPLVIYPFALLQGYIYEKTQSLFYVIVIHLTVDFVLYLTLVNCHFPDYVRIFPW